MWPLTNGKKRKTILTLLSVTLFIVVLTACQAAPEPELTATEELPAETPVPTERPTDQPEESIVVADEPAVARVNLGRLPRTIDPGLIGPLEASANDLVANLFAGLTRLDKDTGEIKPMLAREWQTVDDGTTWQILLRDDVFWVRINEDSGEMERVRPVTAQDAVFAAARACQSGTDAPLGSSPGVFIIQGCRELSTRDPSQVSQEYIEQNFGMRVLNDVALELILIDDIAYFPSILAMPMLTPLPSELLEENGETWTHPENIWTSGAFTLQPNIPIEEGYTLVANEHWPFERAGNVGAVQISFDTTTNAFSAWQSGRLDVTVVTDSLVSDVDFGENPAFRRLAQPATIMLVFAYDTPPVDDILVRQALALALDRDALVAGVFMAQGEAVLLATNLTPPGAAAAPDYGEVGVGYNASAARNALRDAGYPRCRNMPTITILTDDQFETSGLLASRVVEMWQENLDCEEGSFVVEEQSLFDVYTTLQEPASVVQPARPGVMVLGWQEDYPDAHHWATDVVACNEFFSDSYVNQARGCIEAETALLEAANLDDIEERAAVYADLAKAFFGEEGEFPVIPIAFYARPLAINGWVDAQPIHAGPLRFDEWVINTALQP